LITSVLVEIVGLTVEAEEADSGEVDLDQVSSTLAFKSSELGEVNEFLITSLPLLIIGSILVADDEAKSAGLEVSNNIISSSISVIFRSLVLFLFHPIKLTQELYLVSKILSLFGGLSPGLLPLR